MTKKLKLKSVEQIAADLETARKVKDAARAPRMVATALVGRGSVTAKGATSIVGIRCLSTLDVADTDEVTFSVAGAPVGIYPLGYLIALYRQKGGGVGLKLPILLAPGETLEIVSPIPVEFAFDGIMILKDAA